MQSNWKTMAKILGFLAINLLTFNLIVNLRMPSASGKDSSVFSSNPVTPFVSLAVRELESLSNETTQYNKSISVKWMDEIGETGHTIPLDLLAENDVNDGAAPPVLITFEGLGSDGLAPADAVGDVGPDHYVQMVNVSFQIWDKGDPDNGILPSILQADTPFTALFIGSGLTACENENNGNPIVIYDDLANRWLLSQYAITTGNRMCIAISTSPDPTGTYYLYQFDMPAVPDYFKVGAWQDAYYMGTNTGLPNDYYAYAFDRAKMLAGLPATYQYVDGQANFLMPADLDGQVPPPADRMGIFYTMYAEGFANHPPGVDRIALYEFDVDWSTAANSSFSLVSELPITDYNYTVCGFLVQDCIPQPDTSQKLDSLSSWPMFRFQYRNFGDYGAMVGNFTVDLDNTDKAAIRWFEVRETGGGYSLYQEGTYAPDQSHRWNGSIAMDIKGNIALGYNVSDGTTVKPSIHYATRYPDDPPGTLSAESDMWVGNGVQTGINRWGDYSQLAVDPVDGCHFWYTSSYHDVDDGGFNWNTRIGVFILEGCGDFTLSVDPETQSVCAPSDAHFSVEIGQVQGYTHPVTLSTQGEPADTTVQLSANPVIPPGTSSLTVTNIINTNEGTYALDIIGVAATSTHTTTVLLNISTAVPGMPSLTSPGNGATDIPLQPVFTWNAVNGAEAYYIEIATDSSFTNVVSSGTVQTPAFTPPVALSSLTTYFWRVTPSNGCGTGIVSTIRYFTTLAAPGACAAAQIPKPLLFEDFEGGTIPPGWQVSGFDTWETSTARAHSGTYSIHVDDPPIIDLQFLYSPIIVLPQDEFPLSLQFWNHQTIENAIGGCYDGGLIDISINGSSWTQINTGFLSDPIDGLISTAYSNPRGGDFAWCGNPQDWLNSIVDLNAYAGQSIKLRFGLASDSSGGFEGWYLDDVLFQSCLPNLAEGTLQGTITDAETGDGLPGVMISVAGIVTETLTNSSGYYSMTIPAGVYTATASLTDYYSSTVPLILITSENTTTQDIVLNPIPPAADLVLTQISPDTATVRSQFAYQLVVTNLGPDTAISTVLTDTLPLGVSLENASENCEEKDEGVKCELGNLDPGTMITVSLVVSSDLMGILTNVAGVTSQTSDPNPFNNITSVQTESIAEDSKYYLPIIRKK